MHLKIISFISINFLLISCGGGGGSSLENNNLITDNNEIEETCIAFGRNTSRCSFIHDGFERFYLIYKPQSLNEENAPVLFALHGYGSSAAIHKSYTGYEDLADNNKFIVVYPQGYKLESLLVNSSSHWNVGAWTIASEIDDIGFIDTIIDLVINKEQVDETRIYSSGMSNGGFMSFHLACKLSRKIAAIASVTGSMSKETLADCAPNHPTAILQIHGLQDLVVPYSGFDDLGMESIDDALAYWANFNDCNPERLVAVADYFNEKGSIDFIHYESCMNGVDVRLIRIPSMDHTWPALNNFNISASDEIWNFLSQFDLNGKINN
jgi:polyhydroxybutyrate depolymerase